MTRTLRLTLSYDGYDFRGWQIQPGVPTVQGVLAEVIESVTGEHLLPQGSGRTDTGVHALAQVASFATQSPIPLENFKVVLNDRLPPTIRVLQVEEAPPGFHARHAARAKTYVYRIYRGSVCPPFLHRYVWHYPYSLDEQAMASAALRVAGVHDFTSFAAVDPDRARRCELHASEQHAEESKEGDKRGNVRTVFASRLSPVEGDDDSLLRNGMMLLPGDSAGPELIYRVRGNGFLHHMVRNLVGTFLLVGKGTLSADDLPRILAARDRAAAGPTAPASGLCLVSVEY
jgi:tRNA pseudouridine38-40 synthase